MSEKPINQVHTPCKDCNFEIQDGNTQIGCGADMLEKYKDFLIEAYDENGREFFVINERRCLFRRGTDWGKGLSHAEAVEKAKKENQLRVELIVYLDDFNEGVFGAMDKTIRSGLEQNPAIKSITVINNSKVDPLAISDHLSDFISTYEIPWKIKSILEEGATFNRCCDMVVREIKQPYFIACKSGYILPPLLNKIDREINENLRQISFSDLGDDNGYFGNSTIYKFLQGNAGEFSFSQKISEIAKEQNNEDLIYKV